MSNATTTKPRPTSRAFNITVGAANIVSGFFAALAYFEGPPLRAVDIPRAVGTGDVVAAFRGMFYATFAAIVLLSLQAYMGLYAPKINRRIGPIGRIGYDLELDELFEDKPLIISEHAPEVKFFIKAIRWLAGAFVVVVFGLAIRMILKLFLG